MLDKILILISEYSYIEFSRKKNTLIDIGDGYEINSKNALTKFKNLYIELFFADFIFIWIKDFSASNKVLTKIINKHKFGIFGRYITKINLFRKSFYDSKALFYDKDFLNYFDKHQAFLDFDLIIATHSSFIDSIFITVESELGKGEENKNIVGKELYEEINKTLKGKKSYSGEIELSYIFNDFIYGNNRSIYYILEDLKNNNNLKIKNIIIYEGHIKFIISNLVEIEKKLFTNLDIEYKEEDLEIKYIITDKGCNLVKGILNASFIKSEKPFKIVERIFKTKGSKKNQLIYQVYINYYIENHTKKVYMKIG